ncbi:tetratricopeptide repeat protein [Phenylobacterium sp.]|uniref:tetratricopeptide repeat protein n=1 Tax=Phenylobacterium sp. TaxID=1871053 RepID=UPI00374CA7F4
MEFKSGPIRFQVGAKPRDREADRATLRDIEAKLEADEVEAAVALADAALADGLEHPLIFNLAAERLESEDRFGEALVLLERGHSFAPGDLGLRQALGLCLFRLQRFGPALPHFDALIAAEPDFAPSHAARGAALDALGRSVEAEAAFRRAMALQPQNLLAIAGLASVASRAERHAEARGLAEQVLAVEPGYPDAIIVLARADMAAGDVAAADKRLRGVVADSRTPEGLKALAQSLIDDMTPSKDRKFDA